MHGRRVASATLDPALGSRAINERRLELINEFWSRNINTILYKFVNLNYLTYRKARVAFILEQSRFICHKMLEAVLYLA